MATATIARSLRRGWREQRGQAVVEFALIAPILLMILFGIVEFGRAWNAYQVVTDAAREAARRAAVAGPGSLSELDIRKIAGNALGRHGLTNCGATAPDCVTVSPSGSSYWGSGEPPNTGDGISIEIDYPYRFVFLRPFMTWTGAKGQVTLKTRVVFRKE